MATNKTFEQALPVGYNLTGGDRDYEIEKVLGQGGFGITYRVKAHVRVGTITVTTHFAVKEYFPSVCWRDASTLAMLYPPTQQLDVQEGLGDFLGEGRRLQSICKLNPHIVNVNEVFEANGTAYFVMEYLSGGDITGMVARQGTLSEAAMLSIITPVAEALQCLHDNMMLHLDIKPENIVMRQSDDGRPDVPVLIDFGVSVHFRKDGKPTTKKPSKGVTPGYSPAEQFAGVSRFDPRLDIYALSATCYYMLTGRSPKSAFEVDTAELRRDLAGRASDRTIDAIVQGMSREAGGRPATIAQFLKGFKATCALRIGSVVRGNYQNYAIVSVIDETDGDIHYAATTGQDATAAGQPGGTAKVAYDLWSQRIGDNVLAAGQCTASREWLLPDRKAGFAPGQYGFKSQKPGVIDFEYFVNGGVEYVAVRRDYKPTPAWMLQLRQLWHKHSRKVSSQPVTYTVRGVSFTMVAVEGGTFTMGATAEQGNDTHDSEKPAHQVTLSSYSIGQTEVTQALWLAVMGSNPSRFTGNLQRPVEQVSWDDCQTFITKLNQMTGKNFRLPTEAEWEYAARGGNRSKGYKYAGSNNIGDVAWFWRNSGDSYLTGREWDADKNNNRTHPVGSKSPNELGLYDMSGNVWEWCQDWYGSYSSEAQTNPTGPASGSRRMMRGGSWYFLACSVSYRNDNTPSYAYDDLGLRLAL